MIDLSKPVQRDAQRRSRPARWAADLLMGARFAAAGGRDGLTRTAMTAVGVGLGVAMLLLAVAVPGTWAHRAQRMDLTLPGAAVPVAAADTALVTSAPTVFREHPVRGMLIRADGPAAPVPPGLTRLPAPGEAFVSPALRTLLDSADGALLRPRLPYRITATIAPAGLSGPAELTYYAGDASLTPTNATRVAAFGDHLSSEGLSPALLLFVVVIFVVLLLPVAVFIASAVRFGGEQRDRRLAALRLVGADTAMARRMAAGESLAAALLGLLAGGAFFLLGRLLAQRITLADISVYAGDIRPTPGLIALVALVVPALAVIVSLLALRGVMIEPLGVVRRARPARGRLWWRLLPPAAGLALLYPLIGRFTATGPAPAASPYRTAAGVVLLLLGVATLLPWSVEATVARLGRGPVSWQLAVRRLQVSTTSPGRVVNGIAVAVAGAIALQMLFTGLEPVYTQQTGVDLTRATVSLTTDGGRAAAVLAALRATPGVTGLVAVRETQATVGQNEPGTPVLLADCASLRQLATLPSCTDGDVFRAAPRVAVSPADQVAVPGPGAPVRFAESPRPWRVPATARQVPPAHTPLGRPFTGLLITPAATPAALVTGTPVSMYALADRTDPDIVERIRNAAESIEPTASVAELTATKTTNRFVTIRRGLFIGAVVTLLLIGLSLLVGVLEQLRDRRRALAVLAALGVRRRTLGWSVLWQTALPVTLGLLLAVPAGVGLGAVLLAMVDVDLRIDASAAAGMAACAAAVVLLVTTASLPVLWRIMRADGLRTE